MALDFVLISDFVGIQRKSFEVADSTLLDPTSTNPLVLGEWLELTSAYKMDRGTANGATVPSWVMFAEKGRFETQAAGKVPILWLNDFEADTKVMDSTGLAVGDLLMVNDVTYGSLTRRGLKEQGGGAFIVGRVTRLPASNNGYLRFITCKQ